MPLPTAIDLVVAPGETLPTSVPLSSTMWWSVASLFLQTTLLPWAALAGLGVNAALPEEPTIAMVTCDDGDGDGAGAGDGEGAGAGVGAGEGDGVADGELGDEYPPHAETIKAMRTAATVKRGKDIAGYLLGSGWSGAGIDEPVERNGKRRATLYPREMGRRAPTRSLAVTARESRYARRIACRARSLYH